jgi:hypothetical protein
MLMVHSFGLNWFYTPNKGPLSNGPCEFSHGLIQKAAYHECVKGAFTLGFRNYSAESPNIMLVI